MEIHYKNEFQLKLCQKILIDKIFIFYSRIKLLFLFIIAYHIKILINIFSQYLNQLLYLI